jgi:hypothetical protein
VAVLLCNPFASLRQSVRGENRVSLLRPHRRKSRRHLEEQMCSLLATALKQHRPQHRPNGRYIQCKQVTMKSFHSQPTTQYTLCTFSLIQPRSDSRSTHHPHSIPPGIIPPDKYMNTNKQCPRIKQHPPTNPRLTLSYNARTPAMQCRAITLARLQLAPKCTQERRGYRQRPHGFQNT